MRMVPSAGEGMAGFAGAGEVEQTSVPGADAPVISFVALSR